MVEAITGWESSSYEVLRVGERRNHLLRVYNLREGLTAADDILPDRFYDEPIAAGPHAGRMLDRTRFREMVRLYYEAMGWDNEGIPSAATLYDHHLDWTIADLPARENAG